MPKRVLIAGVQPLPYCPQKFPLLYHVFTANPSPCSWWWHTKVKRNLKQAQWGSQGNGRMDLWHAATVAREGPKSQWKQWEAVRVDFTATKLHLAHQILLMALKPSSTTSRISHQNILNILNCSFQWKLLSAQHKLVTMSKHNEQMLYPFNSSLYFVYLQNTSN